MESSTMQTQNVSQEAGSDPGPTLTQGHLHGEAPKITPELIEAEIVEEHYFTAADGVIANTFTQVPPNSPLSLLTLCVLILRNGFTVVGKSACASPANFNADIGRQVARGDAIRQIWPLMGYELRTRLNELSHQEQLGESGDASFVREHGEGMHA
jgi:hypothetical protein